MVSDKRGSGNMKSRFLSSGFGKNFKRSKKKRVRGILGKLPLVFVVKDNIRFNANRYY